MPELVPQIDDIYKHHKIRYFSSSVSRLQFSQHRQFWLPVDPFDLTQNWFTPNASGVLGNCGAHHLWNQILHARRTKQLHPVDDLSFEDFHDLGHPSISVRLRKRSVSWIMDRARNLHFERIKMTALPQQQLHRGIGPSGYLREGWLLDDGFKTDGADLCPSSLRRRRILYQVSAHVSS